MATTAVGTPVNKGVQTSAVSESVKALQIAGITSKGSSQPSRWFLYAPVGFGKTSILAHSPRPIFLMARGETGLETLIDSGQLPPTPHFPEMETWPEVLDAIKGLRNYKHDYRTLVIDTLNGLERMLHEHVCKRDFEGDWGERGFMGFQRGYEVALGDWRQFLNSLDELRRERNMTIFLLSHAKIKTFKNPAGPDYDRFQPEMNDRTWALTRGWLDNILYGSFEVLVKTGQKVPDANRKGKAADNSPRILYSNSDNPVFDAKNRLGLPAEIEMGDSPKEGWTNLFEAIVAARKQTQPEKKEANHG